MPKQTLPVYSMGHLTRSRPNHREFMADEFGSYVDDHQDLRFPHKHSFYQLVYFSAGSGNHSIDFTQFPVEDGQMYFMIPGQVHGWNFANKPEGYIVNFSEKYIQELVANPRYLDQFSFFSGIVRDQVISIDQNARRVITGLLNTIVEEARSERAMKDDFVRASLLQLFIATSRSVGVEKPGTGQTSYNQVLFRNFQKLIDQHYKEKKLTRDYAALLYVTPNHLNALTKDVTGHSAGELIRDRIVLEAKRLLINAQLTITQIATELAFIDNSYFSKFFKKYAGVSPETFRREHLQPNK